MTHPGLTLEELSGRTGASLHALREWCSLGLLGASTEESFSPEDVERARIIDLCVRRGFDAEVIARAEAREKILSRYLDQVFPNGIGATYSLAQTAEMAGLDAELVERLWEAIASEDLAERTHPEDVEMLRGWKVALDAGLPEEALFQVVRVYVDALGRVAEAEAHLFHFYVHERLKDAGLSGPEVVAATEVASGRMRALIEPAVLYFHRRGMARALREDMLLHLAEYAGPVDRPDTPAQLRLAIAFLDLASFTPLTESMGDVAAADVVERFSELVREVVNRHHGRVVERIGDAFMLVFTEPRSAVACALEIELRSTAEPQFTAVRGGVHFGPVLYREGGYVGSNVNIASRVAGEAGRHQLLVTAAVRGEASDFPDVEFVPLGKRALKGVTEAPELFEARARSQKRTAKVIDPVCGMELAPTEVAARLSVEGRERAFCSETCLRMFVEAPEKYRQ
jgi:class 3 adenylate cyclase/DNA-binding transcriptional MerR regulator